MRKIYLLLVLTFFSVVSFSQVSVTATSGTAGPTSYTTVSAAFAAINAGTHKGAVTITISANTTEPALPTALLKSASPSDYTSVLIKPSGNVTVNSPATPSSNRGIIELSGADNVTIDGDDPSTSGSRNLSIVSATSSSTSVFACIRVSSNSTTGADGADNITVKNCIITGSRSSATQTSSSSSSGINLSNYSTTSLTTGAYSNLNNIFENNLITRTMWGIYANGASTSYPNTGLIIRNNVLGSSTSSNNLGRGGIYVTYSSATASGNSAIIEGNDIRVGDVSPSGSGYSLSIAGIDLGTVNAGAIIRKNNIHDIYQPTTSGYGAYGINISGSTNCAGIEISNNFLTNIVACKYSTSNSTYTAFGIRYAAGATLQKILHNTIVLPAAVNGSIANYLNFGIYAVSTATFSKFLNNIIVNSNVGTGTYGFYTSATTNISGGSVDNNDYYVPNGYLGVYNGFAYSTISGWRSATSQEANSLNIEPTFVSSTDFHLNYGTTPSQLESAGATVSSTGINVDFDGQLRPGPSGSVNGGAVYPDIGADEVDAVPLDANPPTISYTPISNACNVGALTLTATITDLFGVPTSGSGLPRIYWKLNSGAWSSTQGTSIGSNQYSFTFAGTAVAGDRVSYYVVAQDNSSNVSALPSSGAGSFTTSPPAAGTPPTSPYTFVMGGMSGTYTIGSASGSNYTRLTDAISDYNSSCLTGPVIFELLDATYSATANSESFPLTINSNSSASATNTLTIRPASGVSVLISGTVNSNGLFRILGSYVTVNGSNNSSTTRDLTLQNLGATNPRVVIVGSTSTTPITNVIIRNTVIENGSNSQTSAQGVLVSSSGGAAGYFNNISIVNNSFVKTYYGVYSTAVSASGNGSGLLIQNNLMNNSGANSIGYSAVYLLGVDGYEVSGNSIGNIETTANNPTGIYIGSNSINGEISKNNISNVAYTGTGGYGGKGIWLLPSNSTANTVIKNNFISDIKGDGWNTFASDAIIGISVANSGSAGGVSVYNNSVNLGSGAFTGYNNGTLSSAFYVGSSATGLDIRNNIFTNNLVNSSNSTAKSYSFYSAAPSSSYTAIDNNCYGVAGSQGVLANLGSDLNTLAAIIAVGGNQNSLQSYPSFTAATNLHLTNAAGDNWCLESAGTPIASATTDIDGDTRDAARPDIGADEFAAAGFTVTSPAAVCAPATVDLTAAAVTDGTISGATFSYFTNVTGTTALSTPTAVAASGTYYIKATNGSCSWIKPVTVTINPQPTPSITGSNSICASSTGNVYSVTNVTGNTYAWTVTGGAVTAGAGTNSITVTWGAAGTGTVEVLETITATSCTQTNSLSVTINPNPTPSITGSTAVCTTNEGYVYSVASVAGNTYSWTVTGGTITAGAGTNSITVSWGAVGAGTVAVTQTITATGCATTVTASINIQELPTASETIVQPVTCASEDGQINLTLGGAVGPYTFAWTGTGQGITATTQNQSAVSAGFYNYTVTAANGCTVSATNVVVNGPGGCFICPTIGSIAASTPIICQNTSNTFTVSGLADLGITYGIRFKYSTTPLANPYLTTAGTVMGTVTNANLTGGGTGAAVTYSFPTSGTMYVYAILTPNSPDPTCRPYVSMTFEVAATPALTDPTDQVLCTGSTTAAVSLVATPSATTTFAWTNSRTSIGLAASGTGNIAAFTATNYTNAPVTATVVVTPTNTQSAGGTSVACVGPTQSFTYTVNPIPTVNTIADQNVCAGTATTLPFSGFVAGTVYEWTNSNTAIGLAASGTGNLSYTPTNTTSSPITATIVVTPKFTNAGVTCTGNPISFTITVNPTPTVAAVDNQVLCNGAATTAVAFAGATTGTVYNWTNSNTSIGLVASGTGDIASFTAVNTGSAAVTSTITVTPTYTAAGFTCTGTTTTFTITVNPTPRLTTVSNSIICNGSSNTIALAGPVTGSVYSWTNDNTAIGLGASGTGNITFTATNPGPDPITGTVSVTPSYTNAGLTCTGTASTFTVTVNPSGQVNTVTNQVLCNGSATSAVTFSTTNNGLISTGGTQTAASGTISVTVPDASAAGATHTIPVNLPTGAVINNMRVTMNMTHTWISDMVINLKAPNGQILNLFNQHGGSGDNLVNTVVSSTGTTAFSSGSAPFTGTFAATAASGQGPTGNVSNAANFAALYSTPNGNWVLAMRDLFGGDLGVLTSWSISIDYTVLGTFGTNMNWTNNTTSIGLGASGTGNIPSFTAVNNGSAPVTSTVTVTPVYFNGGTSCPGTPGTFTYTVNPTPSLNAVSNQVLCASTPANIALTGPVSSTVYTWTNSNTAIGLGASGTGNLVFTPTTGTTPTIATITATPSTPAVGGAVSLSPAPSNMMAYRANVGTVYSMTLTGATSGIIWGTNIYTDDSYLNAAAVHAGVLTAGQTATVYVEVMAGQSSYTSSTQNGITSYSWGAWAGSYKFLTSAPSAGAPGCTGTPRTFTITVNPVGQANAVTSQVLCNGSNTTAVSFATVNGGGTIVAGTPVVTNSGTIAVVVPDANAAGIGATLPVTLPAGATVTGVSVNFNMSHTWVSDMVFNLKAPNGQILNLVNRRGGGGDNFTNTNISSAGTASLATAAAPFTGTFAADAAVGVGPTGQLSTAANFAALYSVGSGDWTLQMRDYAGGDVGTLTSWSITINYTTLVPAVTSYAWTNNLSSIGLAASGTGNIASFAATNTTAAPVTATVTVTPTYNNAGVGCAGTPISYTYTVNPTPTVNAVSNQTVCVGSNVAAVNYTGATTGTVYNWTNSNTAIGLAASGTGNIASFVGRNTSAAPISGTITVTPVYTNAGVTCTGTPRTFIITVNPIPTVNPVANFAACHNTTAAAAFSGATTGTVFNWTNSNPAIGLPASGSGSISFTALNTTSAPVTATITVTPSFTNGGTTCVGTPTSFVITVNPLPVVTTGALPGRICISDTLVRLNGTPVGGSWSGFGISGFNFMPPATDVGTWPITYTYADANGCVNRATTNVTVLACEERNRDLDNGAVILYPNPNSGQFNLRVNSTRFNVLGMKVYNTAGQLVYTNQWRGLVFARVIPVNLNNLAAGNYMVRLYYGDGMDRGADKTYQVIIAR